MNKAKLTTYLLGTAMTVALGAAPALANDYSSELTSEQSPPVVPAATGSEDSSSGTVSDTDTQNPGDIIVTANRRAERLSRVGVSVAAVLATELALFDVDQPQDLRRVVPGFQALESASTGAPIYVLRGVGFDAPAPATSSPVGIYQDEVSVPYAYMSLGLAFDLERLEVLKGPQGTVYGRNTTGGLVNFIAAKPTDTSQGGFTVGAGSYEFLEAEGFVSGPLGGGLKGRLAFQTQNRNRGWQRSVTRPNDRLGDSFRKAMRATLQYAPDDSRLDITATGSFWEIQGDTQAPQAVEFIRNAIPPALVAAVNASIITNPRNSRLADFTPIGRQPNQALQRVVGIGDPDRPPLRQDTRFYSTTLRANLGLNDVLTIASLTNYSDLKYDSTRDFGGLQTESLTQRSSGAIRTFSQELRLLGETNNLSFSVGGYYAHDKTRQRDLGFVGELSTIVEARAFLPILNPLFGNPFSPAELATTFRNYAARGESTVDVLAGFANVEFRVTDQLKLRAGGRYTRDKEVGSSCALNVNGGQTAFVALLYPVLTGNFALPRLERNSCYTLTANNSGFTERQNRQRDTNFSWRLGVDYAPSDTSLIYAVLSRGYKSGAFPVNAAANETQLNPVRPEELTDYEAGIKLQLLDRALQFSANAFYYDYKDRQTFGRVPDVVFGSLLRIVNIPSSKAYGAEADATLRMGQFVTGRASIAYLKTRVGNFIGFDTRSQAGIVTDFSGADFPYSPKIQASGSLVADFPVSETVGVLAAINASYQSRSSGVLGSQPGFDIDPFTVVGIKAGVHGADDSWALEGYVNNLFDEYYFTSAQRGNETLLRYAGMPRTYGVRASFKF